MNQERKSIKWTPRGEKVKGMLAGAAIAASVVSIAHSAIEDHPHDTKRLPKPTPITRTFEHHHDHETIDTQGAPTFTVPEGSAVSPNQTSSQPDLAQGQASIPSNNTDQENYQSLNNDSPNNTQSNH